MQSHIIKNNQGLDLYIYTHTAQNPVGTAVVVHGLGAYVAQPQVAAVIAIFVRQNYNVVSFDATNSLGASGGDFYNATISSYYADFLDVMAWCQGKPWFADLTLAGMSLGGYSVCRFAAANPQLVKAIMPISTFVSGELSHQAHQKYSPDTYAKWQATGVQETPSVSRPGVVRRLPWSHMQERLNHDLLPVARQITCPALFIVGDQDTSTPQENVQILYEALGSKDKTLHIIPGAPHTLRTTEHITAMQNAIESWLTKI